MESLIVDTDRLGSLGITDGVTEYEDAKAQMKAAVAAMRQAAGRAFRSMCDSVFTQFPTLDSFTWAQYTPYWNDGDECSFSVHAGYNAPSPWNEYKGSADGVGVNGGSLWDDEDEEGEPLTDELKSAVIACAKLINEFDDSDLESMFGDHVEITVYRDGRTTTEQHEHD